MKRKLRRAWGIFSFSAAGAGIGFGLAYHKEWMVLVGFVLAIAMPVKGEK